jgi:diguanylate cyclase (GGDEF)-like protein
MLEPSMRMLTQPVPPHQERPLHSIANKIDAQSLVARITLLEREKRELEVLANQLELNIKQLIRLAYEDALTGLSNRRHFDSELERAMKRVAVSTEPLALLMCDIDAFKHYNDAYGHGHGDTVIVEIARLLRQFRRDQHDCVARYGGEEFAVLLPATETEAALLMAERIRAAVAAMRIRPPYAAAGRDAFSRVTISVGVTTLTGPSKWHSRQVVDAADNALYAAKRAKGNQTRFQPLDEGVAELR